jgi:glycosyltransferase involved in cell wall biosynthesis
MKIVAVLEGTATDGGGFNQALNAILQMRRLCEGRYDFEVLTDREANVGHLAKLGVGAGHFRLALLDRLIAFLCSHPWWFALQARLKLVSPFETRLLRQGCDLVYFLTPSARAKTLQRLNYVATVWDLCHRDAPEFPEIREFEQFRIREHLYRGLLPPAVAILTDSAQLADAAARRYGVDRERFLPMPFGTSAYLDPGTSPAKGAVLEKYGLHDGYFFYPAQFWPHKNHVRILQALLLLKSGGHPLRVAFAGGDQGNRAHLERFVEAHALGDQVRFLGFVPGEDLRGLYEGCRAVVMPTYFGPTNIPPLEAWLTGKPLIYTAHFTEQAGDAALCVDPDDASGLAHAMRACEDAETCDRLVKAGTLRLQQIEQQRKEAEVALLARLRQFEARRACWP